MFVVYYYCEELEAPLVRVSKDKEAIDWLKSVIASVRNELRVNSIVMYLFGFS